MIKVLIVDDSAFMRVKIRSIIESDPNMRVIGVARNGLEAVEKVKTLQPDVGDYGHPHAPDVRN